MSLPNGWPRDPDGRLGPILLTNGGGARPDEIGTEVATIVLGAARP